MSSPLVPLEVTIAPASLEDRLWAATLMASSDPWRTLGRDLTACLAVVAAPDDAPLCVARDREGPFWATMLTLEGEDTGTAGGIMNFGSNVRGFISPRLTPRLAAWIGWERALQIGGLLGIIAGVLWLWVTPGCPPATSSNEIGAAG